MLTIWKFVDGKSGHENQTHGLASALQQRTDVVVIDLDIHTLPNFVGLLWSWIARRKPQAFPNSKPDLIVGAGRRTHLPMVVAKSLCGGRNIVLMRPSLPQRLFDLVVVPEHDDVQPRPNVLQVSGVLNAIPYVKDKNLTIGLMLVGGESSHYTWDDRLIIDQIQEIVESDPSVQWTLTTSRRTPQTFLELLHAHMNTNNFKFVPFEDTDQNWMLDQLRVAGQVWVSPDSVSMVYEALSSGAIVQVFSLEPLRVQRDSRVVRGVATLIDRSIVTTFDHWKIEPALQHKLTLFNEADRVAKVILEQLL